MTFNKEAWERFLAFAVSSEAQWSGNFRDLNAAVCRMATLAESKRIGVELVDEETERLRATWRPNREVTGVDEQLPKLLSAERLAQLDLFDRAQLEFVIRVCRESASLSDAGRKLYAVTREKRKDNNDADRLRKYLLRFGLGWQTIRSASVMESHR